MPRNTTTPKTWSRKNFTLLVIEDNADQLLFIRYAAEKIFEQVKLVFVSSQQEAQAFLDQCMADGFGYPQLILLDLYLPSREAGWQLLDKIKSMPSPLHLVPVVVLSSSLHQEDISASYDRGINSYIVKPLSTESWIAYFQELKEYWLETVSLPAQRRFWA